MNKYVLESIGTIRSEIKKNEDAPKFYTEGAPNAHLELRPSYVPARAMELRNHYDFISNFHPFQSFPISLGP
jgi:hypothetical protein